MGVFCILNPNQEQQAIRRTISLLIMVGIRQFPPSYIFLDSLNIGDFFFSSRMHWHASCEFKFTRASVYSCKFTSLLQFITPRSCSLKHVPQSKRSFFKCNLILYFISGKTETSNKRYQCIDEAGCSSSLVLILLMYADSGLIKKIRFLDSKGVRQENAR